MRLDRLGLVATCLVTLAACGGGPGADAPTDASIEEFCASKDWFVQEGLERFRGGDFPPSEEAVAELARDWTGEFTRVGTPANMSPDARSGFEKFVARLDDIDGGDMSDFGWQDGDWENDEEEAFANYVTNTCP